MTWCFDDNGSQAGTQDSVMQALDTNPSVTVYTPARLAL
jgi:hypothetical protein